jgi:hypothetical protein
LKEYNELRHKISPVSVWMTAAFPPFFLFYRSALSTLKFPVELANVDISKMLER